MIAARREIKLAFALASSALALAAVGGADAAAAGPVKLVLANHFGREVNLTQVNLKSGPAFEDICSTESGDTCQPGTASASAGGFTFPEGTAGAPNGSVFVADQGNHRVDEFTGAGAFVLAFGREVDASTHGDVCTAASHDTCQAGVRGPAAGQLDTPGSVAVDPLSGDVYVEETVFGHSAGETTFGERVQKFTASGQFVLEIGDEVNEGTKGNLCTQEEVEKGVKCVGPAQRLRGAPLKGAGHGVLELVQREGDVLAAGGEHDRLYVASRNSVQEFEAGGAWVGETPIANADVAGVAVDPVSNDLYAIYRGDETVHRFNAKGEALGSFPVSPAQVGATVALTAIAIDGSSRLAVSGREELGGQHGPLGFLYNAGTGHLLTAFDTEGEEQSAISFNGVGELFGASTGKQEILGYKAEPVAELTTGEVKCQAGAEIDTTVPLQCMLEGTVNPESVPGTEVWFEYGTTCNALVSTPRQPVVTNEEPQSVTADVSGLRPKQQLCYQLAGVDDNLQPSEKLSGEAKTAQAPTVAPRIVGEPSASFVKSSSVVMSGELNPENAETEYTFEYGPCSDLEDCAVVEDTTVLLSHAYGRIGATLEAQGLQPSTTYTYRLAAVNEEGETGVCVDAGEGACEGHFTTAPAPVPAATTLGADSVGPTSAVVSGIADSNGKPATYAFELGLDQGSATRYGVVFSGSTSGGPTSETLLLTGLQPGAKYDYRIAVRSGYGTAVGQAMSFTTPPLPGLEVPTPPQILPPPSVPFPRELVPPKPCKRGYQRDKHGKCVKTKAKKKARKGSNHKKAKKRR